MFLNALKIRNPELIKASFGLYERDEICPNTYVLDYDVFVENARLNLEAAKANGVTLYFMLKQLGRNPLLAKTLVEMGYKGAVCVDFEEAMLMLEHGIPLGNIGHLVQIPQKLLPKIITANPEIITVYTFDKIREIDAVSKKLQKVSHIMLKVTGAHDLIYSSQESGFAPEEIPALVDEIEKLKHVKIAGVTSFPCFLMDEQIGDTKKTPNLESVLQVEKMLESYGYTDLQINLPSASCVHTMPMIASYGGTHAEPGHALSGTTPYHAAVLTSAERPALAYVSEISHTFRGKSYCYGGGLYRRGHMAHALVGKSMEDAIWVDVTEPACDSIDYHFELSAGDVSQTAVLSFRTQIFVTRSKLAIVKGIQAGYPEIVGVFSSNGQAI